MMDNKKPEGIISPYDSIEWEYTYIFFYYVFIGVIFMDDFEKVFSDASYSSLWHQLIPGHSAFLFCFTSDFPSTAKAFIISIW